MSSGEPQPIQQFKYSKRVVLKSILSRDDRGLGLVGETVVVGGWVKAKKEKYKNKNKKKDGFAAEVPESNVSCYESLLSRIPLFRLFARVVVGTEGALVGEEEELKNLPSVVYLRINDGSCAANLQVLVDSSMSLVRQVMSTGSSILVEGVLEQPLTGGKHAVELKVSKILHVGVVDSRKYPLAKPRLTLEFLRAHPHFRPRTTTIASVTRIRNTLSYATHKFFQTNGFLYVHMPIITTTDTGTSTKKFQVTTLLSKPQEMRNLNATNEPEAISLAAVKKAIKEKSDKVEELQRSGSNKEALVAAIQDLQKANELVLHLEGKQKATSSEVEELDFSKDFFSCQAYLSVSSGLHLESFACALSSVYTFGPIFRAEESQSLKNLAEMWMVEVELAFADLEDVINCAEDFLKFLIQSTLNDSSDDMNFLSKRIDQYCVSRLQSVCSDPFARITYAEALEILKATDEKFETDLLVWGICLSEEHESYLANEVYKKPVIIYEYPKEVKPFYVHIRDDGRTASAFDIIAPKVGVLVRGSQREENIDKISARMEELGLARGSYEWYLDLRRHGRVKHSGFSLMFEKMVMFATGLDNIKDAIPFPRSYGSAHT